MGQSSIRLDHSVFVRPTALFENSVHHRVSADTHGAPACRGSCRCDSSYGARSVGVGERLPAVAAACIESRPKDAPARGPDATGVTRLPAKRLQQTERHSGAPGGGLFCTHQKSRSPPRMPMAIGLREQDRIRSRDRAYCRHAQSAAPKVESLGAHGSRSSSGARPFAQPTTGPSAATA